MRRACGTGSTTARSKVCLYVTRSSFSAIAGNLPTAPALMNNLVIWKPAGQQLAAGYTMELLGPPDTTGRDQYGHRRRPRRLGGRSRAPWW